jgi:cobalt-precorrin-5B (C1)-methyltransferase
MAKRLRSGYTTGACAAAAAKAAALVARDGTLPELVELVFPDNSVHSFVVYRAEKTVKGGEASVIKDAGDDPDVTNRAEIVATVHFSDEKTVESDWITMENVQISAGPGVGTVTKPGLAVPPGEPAINPVPREMICRAVQQVENSRTVHFSISVPKGEELAEKTLNHRLGIIGGLSILGTTGIVRPVSADAWKATIEASMSVAREAGLDDIVLSTGRTSEKGAQSLLNCAVEAYAMMGDYLEFSLLKASEKGFRTIHLAGMWAKIMKAAMQIPQTHVRHGALEVKAGADMLEECGIRAPLLDKLQGSNTAREMYTHLEDAGRQDVVRMVLKKARDYAREVSNREVRVYLVDAKAKVVDHV